MRARRTRRGLVVLAVAGLVTLTACGSKGAPAGRTPLAPEPPAAVTTAPGAATPGATTPDPGSTPRSRPGLSELASALGEQGRGAFQDVYGSLELDNDRGTVALYVTDAARGRALVDAAGHARPDVDTGPVRVESCPFTKVEIDRAMAAVMAAKLPAKVFSAAMAPHATGLVVETDEASARSAALQAALAAAAGRVPVTLTVGAPAQDM